MSCRTGRRSPPIRSASDLDDTPRPPALVGRQAPQVARGPRVRRARKKEGSRHTDNRGGPRRPAQCEVEAARKSVSARPHHTHPHVPFCPPRHTRHPLTVAKQKGQQQYAESAKGATSRSSRSSAPPDPSRAADKADQARRKATARVRGGGHELPRTSKLRRIWQNKRDNVPSWI